MPTNNEHISFCEEIFNKVATELVLATPGSDNGLVPTYSLMSEFHDQIQDDIPEFEKASSYVLETLNPLLDEGLPFDDKTLDYLNNFINWAQENLLNLKLGKELEPIDPPKWLGIESAPSLDMEGNAIVDIEECNNVINKIATELILASPGTDDSMVPIYSLITDFEDLTLGNDILLKSAEHLKGALDKLLDQAKPWDSRTLGYIGSFTTWAQVNLPLIERGEHDAVTEFGPIAGEELDPAITESIPQATPSAAAISEEKDQAKLAEIAAETDVLLKLGEEEDQEILIEFQTEAIEHLEQIEGALLVLEKDPKNEESLASIFRSFHTIKGVAGFLHLTPIQSLAHEIEFLLDKARNKKLTLNSSMITLILKSQDAIQALVDQITHALEEGGEPDKIIPVAHLILKAKKYLNGEIDDAADTPMPTAVAKTTAPVETPTNLSELNKPIPAESQATKATPTANAPTPPKKNTHKAISKAERATIRVSTLKLDNLMDMVGELVIVQSQLTESGRAIEMADNTPFQRNLAQLHRITRELQHTSMSLRLVPIKPTFQKVGRLVRDLSRTFNKKVNLIVEGEDTELDRNVVEQINDPLVHMVRNAIDHGLESNADRINSGKAENGTVQLKAYHLGSNVVIELSDDGRGIDPEKILEKARSRGLIGENVEPSKAEILSMIFEPGFSTAEKVTDVSGRGVGMDVVRRNIEQLRGKVELDSELGKGTSFKIKLPLTTAIIDGMVVRVGPDKFILPTTSVQVALKAKPEQISKIRGRTEVLDLRGRTIPIVRLHNLFNIETEITDTCEGIIVIIETFGKPFGLLVDEMLSKQEVVIKSLGNLMQGISGVAGGAILGDGTIALILDPSSLVGNT